MLVADAVERRQYVGGEPAGFFQHGRGDVTVEIAVVAGLHGGLKPSTVVEGEQHVVDRRAVGHGIKTSHGGKTKTVFPRNDVSLNSRQNPWSLLHARKSADPPAKTTGRILSDFLLLPC